MLEFFKTVSSSWKKKYIKRYIAVSGWFFHFWGGGGLQPKKNRKKPIPNFKFAVAFVFFFSVFSFFFGIFWFFSVFSVFFGIFWFFRFFVVLFRFFSV